MRLCVKKTYCPRCQRLVRGHEQDNDTNIRVLCSRCGLVIWIRDGMRWMYVTEESLTAKTATKNDN